MNRIDKKFRELKARNEKAFMPFLTAGYPDLATTEKLILEFEKRGADIIELGIPFSDPIADGPVIQKSSYEAIKKGTTLKKALELVSRLRKRTQVPLAAMTYFNLILSYGPSRFIRDALAAGLDGVIIPDLPPEEEADFSKEARQKGLKIVLFIAPTTTPERAKFIARRAGGFIYFVSLTGVTGARKELPKELGAGLRAAKRAAGKTPVCAGFGVSTHKQVKDVSVFCDGVIVGSAIIRKISENLKKPGLVGILGDLIEELKG
jgi:tryptophan synthase alpha chain